MLKAVGILVGGVFIGAVGFELLRRKHPDMLDNLYGKVRDEAVAAKNAFTEGYYWALDPHRSPSSDLARPTPVESV